MANRQRLVLVEDDSALLSALSFAFEIEGYEVSVFRDAEGLLAEPELPKADCLVVDQILPGMTGLELLVRLRQQGVQSPAILISTPTVRTVALAQAVGVPLVAKPLISNALVDEVRRQIGQRTQEIATDPPPI